jgi:hypothetical protein
VTRDPLLLLIVAALVLGGLALRGSLQARLARRLGDGSAAAAGYALPEPLVHYSLLGALLYLVLGLALPRPVPLALRGRPAALTLLSGPLLLLLMALLLLLVQRLQLLYWPGLDIVARSLTTAAYGLSQHAVYFLLPLSGLDLGRTLLYTGPPPLRRLIAAMHSIRLPLLYGVWLLLALSGSLGQLVTPVWNGLRTLAALWPV